MRCLLAGWGLSERGSARGCTPHRAGPMPAPAYHRPAGLRRTPTAPLRFDPVSGASPEAHDEAAAGLAGLDSPADVLHSQWVAEPLRPSFYVALDRRRQCVVLAVRWAVARKWRHNGVGCQGHWLGKSAYECTATAVSPRRDGSAEGALGWQPQPASAGTTNARLGPYAASVRTSSAALRIALLSSPGVGTLLC